MLFIGLFLYDFYFLRLLQSRGLWDQRIHQTTQMVIITILLLAVLFIAGLINLFFCFPTKRFYSWCQSLFSSKYSPISENCDIQAPKKGLSAEKREELRRVFATFDKNSDGFITKQELRESLKNIGILLTMKDVEEMVERVDANGDGLIDPDEFCELYESMGGGGGDGERGEGGEGEDAGEKEMKDAFAVFDGDGDGLISVEELRLVLSSLGLKEGKRLEDCKEMIRKVDMDGDGMVNFEEFKKMMKAGGKRLLSASS
ncbi:hypothetical protein PVL29_014389 [Vitis rotundifolia]|uniref:EF-hand domain-containing protein n=1 Tax=Vitis rotundifolia TaxID=103349 RepID=A0AA39DNR0_VITRO|nr:hypothetical protein PVL29_014389 [Vitis rotundifolia]